VGSERELRAILHDISAVDAVGAASRVAKLATRSLKQETKAHLLDLAISMIDLTTLEGSDTSGKIRSLCSKAVRPDPSDSSVPSVAAVCVYSDFVRLARECVTDSNVVVASVATAFPSGRASMQVKLADVAEAVDAGAHEIDMVIDRGAFLSGDWLKVYDEVVAVKSACGSAHLKVILETGELGTLDNIRRASWLAMLAGADFIKTSTGKIPVAATPTAVLVMLEAVRDFARDSGKTIGVKAAGGIRTSKDALKYLVLVDETAGAAWMTPANFRFGASSLLNDLLMQRAKFHSGVYVRPDRFSAD
jgi:deoxyribose-phosphate aldolase